MPHLLFLDTKYFLQLHDMHVFLCQCVCTCVYVCERRSGLHSKQKQDKFDHDIGGGGLHNKQKQDNFDHDIGGRGLHNKQKRYKI